MPRCRHEGTESRAAVVALALGLMAEAERLCGQLAETAAVLPRAAGPLRPGTVWGKQLALSMLADAGFGNVESKEIDSDPFNAYFVTGK
jgi:hypothetical protein